MADETLGKLLVEIGIEATGFQGQMQEISRRMGMAKAEFMAAGGSVKGFQNTTEGAAAKARMLTEQIELQKAKVAALENEYQQAAAGGKETAKAAQNLKMKLDGTRGEVVRLENELNQMGEAEKKAKTHSADLSAAMDKAREAAGKLAIGIGHATETATRLATIGLGGIIAAAGAAVAGTFKLAQGASDLNEAQNVVQQTFKTSSDAVIEWTKTTAKSAGISQTNSTAWVGSMGAMLKSSGVTEQSAGKMSESLVQLSGDLASFYNLSGDDAWEKIRSGMAGETEPLKELGINMSVANLQAEALAEGIKKPYAKMSQSEQTQLRYNYLMKVTADAQGDFGRTLETSFANQLRVAQMNLEQLGMSIGSKFLPPFMSMLDAVNKGFNTGDWKTAAADISKALNDVLAQVTGMIPTVIDMAAQIVPGLVTGIVKALPSFTMALAKGFMDAGKQLIAQIPVLAPAILSTLQTMIAYLVTAIQQFGPQIIGAGIELFVGFFSSILRAIPFVLPTLITGALRVVNAIVGLISDNGPQFINVAIGAIGQLALGLLQALPQLAQAAIQMILALVNGISAQLPTLIPAAVQAILTIVMALVDNLPMLIDAAIGLILALVDGLIKALPKIIEAAPKIITSLVNGLVTALPKLLDAALQIIMALVNAFPDLYPKIIKATGEIMGSLVGGLISAVGKVWEFIPKLWTEIKNSITSKDWGQMGKNMISGLVDGLKAAGDSIWTALKGIVTNAMDSFKRFFGIHSPSTYMRDQLGIHLGGGIADGILGSAGMVGNAMMSLRSQLNLDGAFGGGTMRLGVAGGASSTTSIDNSRAPQIHIHGNVNLADKGSQNATLQQLQFLAAI